MIHCVLVWWFIPDCMLAELYTCGLVSQIHNNRHNIVPVPRIMQPFLLKEDVKRNKKADDNCKKEEEGNQIMKVPRRKC